MKTGDVVLFQECPYLIIGESTNGVHTILTNSKGSQKISVAPCLLRPLPYSDAYTPEVELLFDLRDNLFGGQ